ncbi:MFS transporter [Planococcus halotolerans]|uniref:MFS transporter n=1 Tax=Planococcus halotolerans TaxID=2233542 RepID=A0A365KXD9_9BACL|nr:MFS transporter [Planococcus halotolerans]QHJ72182.1 MFS transporter [Planococcus halotolerans]RAZ77800.1 MFS transporter [Planococcus halotolerans]
MNQTKPKLWTKEFILISTVNFFLTLVFFLLIVTIAVYAVAEYGATTSQAGLVTGIAIIGTMTGRIIIGRLIENIGRKKTLVIGLILFVLTTLLYFVNLNLSFLLVNRFLHGMTLGMASTAAGTIVAQIIPMTRKGEGIGYFSMSSTLATAIGPFIGLYMSQHTSFDMIFTLCVVFGLVSLSFALFTKVPPVDYSSKTGQARGFKLSDFLEPKALPIALITLTSALCFSSILSFINFYAIEIDLVETASFFFVVYAIAVLLSRPFTGRLMDIKGANFVMYPAFVFLAAGLLLLSTASSSPSFLLSAILIGLGFGNLQSTTQAIAVKLTPTHRMGLATSTFFIFLDAGLGFGPYILGFIIPLTGFSSLYAILGFTALAATLLYYVLHGRKERAESTAASIS